MMPALLVSLVLAVAAPNFTYTPEEIAEREAVLQKWSAYAQEANSTQPEAAIERLGLGLRQTTSGAAFPPLEERISVVREELVKALLAIPGHAEFFATRLREAEVRMNNAKTNSERGALRATLTSEQQDAFQTLGLLPSAETVRVLGEFLYDDKGIVPKTDAINPQEGSSQYDKGYSPNSVYALQSIAKLPLVSPPVPTRKGNLAIYDEDIEAWRLWFEQVKSGKRTFRFEGNPQNYSLAGHVTEAREPKSTRPAAEANTAPATPTETAKKTTGIPFWPLALAGGLLAVAAWFAMKRKPAAS